MIDICNRVILRRRVLSGGNCSPDYHEVNIGRDCPFSASSSRLCGNWCPFFWLVTQQGPVSLKCSGREILLPIERAEDVQPANAKKV